MAARQDGAGGGNRTLLSSLGSSHSTDELHPQRIWPERWRGALLGSTQILQSTCAKTQAPPTVDGPSGVLVRSCPCSHRIARAFRNKAGRNRGAWSAVRACDFHAACVDCESLASQSRTRTEGRCPPSSVRHDRVPNESILCARHRSADPLLQSLPRGRRCRRALAAARFARTSLKGGSEAGDCPATRRDGGDQVASVSSTWRPRFEVPESAFVMFGNDGAERPIAQW